MSPTMIAIMATGLILPDPWRVFCGWIGVVDIDIELGEEATTAGFLPGTTGDAIAPSDPGFVGSLATFLHIGMGDPQRIAFRSKEDTGNVERVFGISPAKRFPETLKSCRFGRFKPVMVPENRFSSRRRVRMCANWLTVAGISPDKLL